MRRVSANADDYYTNYIVYPLQILSSASVDEASMGKQVVDVKYVTPSGITSETPQEGVNIVIMTHGDGSRTAVKRLGK